MQEIETLESSPQDEMLEVKNVCCVINKTVDEPEGKFMFLIHFLVSQALEEYHSSTDTNPERKNMTFHPYDTIRETLEYLHYVFMRKTEEIFYKNTEAILGSRASRVHFLLSRCLAICDEPSNISFLVMCTFIYDMIFYWLFERTCYRLFFDSEFCLLALYKRKFWKIFRNQKDFDELVSFSRTLAEILEPKIKANEFDNVLDALPDHGQHALQLMEKCVNATETDVSFTPWEVKFLGLNSEEMDSNDVDCERCKLFAFEAFKKDAECTLPPLCMKLSRITLESLEKFKIAVCEHCNTGCDLYLHM